MVGLYGSRSHLPSRYIHTLSWKALASDEMLERRLFIIAGMGGGVVGLRMDVKR